MCVCPTSGARRLFVAVVVRASKSIYTSCSWRRWRRGRAPSTRPFGRLRGRDPPFPGRRWPAAVLASIKYRRRGLGADDATGGPWYYRLLRRAADVVAGPRPRERAGRGLQGVLGPIKYRKRGLTVAVDRVDDRLDAIAATRPRTEAIDIRMLRPPTLRRRTSS